MANLTTPGDACLPEAPIKSIATVREVEPAPEELKPISLGDLIEIITDELQAAFRTGGGKDIVDLGARTRIADAMQALDTSDGCLDPFMLFDEHKCYTRNLVATDHETFTLLLLCWNGGKASPIHDHPCRGCWMRVCEGTVFETRYGDAAKEGATADLTEGKTYTYSSPQCAYVHDSMGLHRVGASPSCERAATLHLYAPPFDSCRVWLDASKPDRVINPIVTFYSEYGEIVDYTPATASTGAPTAAAATITDASLCEAAPQTAEASDWRVEEPTPSPTAAAAAASAATTDADEEDESQLLD